jgi:hypothetical protein
MIENVKKTVLSIFTVPLICRKNAEEVIGFNFWYIYGLSH